MTEQRTGEMEPGHDHRTGVICHLPEELTAQHTGKGVNFQVLEVNYIACIECFNPTFAAKTNIFFVCSFVFSSIQAQFVKRNKCVYVS